MKATRVLPVAALGLAMLLGGCASVPPGASSSDAAAAGTAAPPAAPAPDMAATPATAQGEAPSSTAAPVTAHPGPATAPVPVDPLRPDVPVQTDEAEARADLWQRVREGFSMPDLDGELVRDREQYYASRPDYVARMTERSNRYLFHILQEVQRRNLPSELALLPFIESAFNPQALSSAKASGIWQFMPATGRHYDLTQNVFRDDRRDVLASTRAALDYLVYLHGMFGDWHLTLAAYNWGEGNVQRAIARNRRAGLGTGYEDLRMPAETRYYVPKLQAVKNIVAEPGRFAIVLPRIENHPYFLSVPIERDIDISLAASLAGLDLDEFKALNPQMNRPVILAAGTPQVLLPYDNANRFVREFAAHNGPYASWTAWTAPTTMRLAEAAKAVGMEETHLREVNRIPPRMLVRAGSTLLVPRARGVRADVSPHLAENAMMLLAPEGRPQRRIVYKAPPKGSSVAAVAKRYRVPAAQVAQWNGVGTGAQFRAGHNVVVYLPARAATAPKPAKARTTKSAAAAKRGTTANAKAPAPRRAAATKAAPKSAKSTQQRRVAEKREANGG